MTAEQHIKEQYELMLDNIGKPYDGRSLWSRDLDLWICGGHEGRAIVREKVEGTPPMDGEPPKAREFVRQTARDAVDSWLDEALEKRLGKLFYQMWTPRQRDLEDRIEKCTKGVVEDIFGLTPEQLLAKTDEAATKRLEAVCAAYFEENKARMTESIKEYFTTTVNEWTAHTHKEVNDIVAEQFNHEKLQQFLSALEKRVMDYFKQEAEQFLRDSLKLKVEYRPSRKLILS